MNISTKSWVPRKCGN